MRQSTGKDIAQPLDATFARSETLLFIRPSQELALGDAIATVTPKAAQKCLPRSKGPIAARQGATAGTT